MISVIKGPVTQYGTQTLQGVLTVKELKEVFDVDNYDRDLGRPGEEAGYQRDPEEKRITSLARSIADGLVVATSIVVNNREPNPKNLTFDKNGVTLITLPKKLWAIDAQHRCMAWIQLYDNASDYGVSKKEVGDYKVNFTMYWGADIEEEVLTFYDVNHFGKGIKIENRLELDVYLNKKGVATHSKDEKLVEIDDLVESININKVWKDKIRFANTKSGTVPKSAMVQSLKLIFGDKNSSLQFFNKKEREELIIAVWEGLSESYSEIINDDEDPKDWALQKAIGVNIIHRLIPFIYAHIQTRNDRVGTMSQKQDPLKSKVWKKYFDILKHNHEDINDYGDQVNGVNFWKSGKEGAARQYSSGKGRNTLLETLQRVIQENYE